MNPTRSLVPDAHIQLPTWPTKREALAKSLEITQRSSSSFGGKRVVGDITSENIYLSWFFHELENVDKPLSTRPGNYKGMKQKNGKNLSKVP